MTATLRPLTDESVGTCDWGDCDDLAVAERRDDATRLGWLSVCARHTGRRDHRPSPGRAACSVCGKTYTLTVDGRMRHHDRAFAERCPGSGSPAMIEVGSSGGAVASHEEHREAPSNP